MFVYSHIKINLCYHEQSSRVYSKIIRDLYWHYHLASTLDAEKIILNLNKEVYEGPVLKVAILGPGSYGTRVADAMQACTKAKLVGAISGTPFKLTTWQTKNTISSQN